MDAIEVKITRRVNRRDLIRLYRAAGWWKPWYSGDAPFIDAMVRGSFCFVGAFHKKKLIGMGRCLSDGVSDAYIQDVTVLPRFRKKGVGARIIGALVEFLRARGIEWIGLIAEPGSGRLYETLGFSPFKKCTPMVWSGDE